MVRRMDPEMLPFAMESGLSFPCRRIDQLASVARSAVEHASIFPIEPSPAFRGIQARIKVYLAIGSLVGRAIQEGCWRSL